MELCSDGHDEICYDGRKCPLCEVIQEKEAVEKELEEALNEIQTLKSEG